MAKVDSAVIDELPPEDVATVDGEVEEVEEEGKQKRHREKWQGGYNAIFDDVDSCKHNPVLTENGEPTDLFYVYKITEKDSEDKNVVKDTYTWARNNTEALINVIDATLNLHCSKLDAKRGRQKMFKPDVALVALLNSMKERSDMDGIAKFLELMPSYQYVIDGTEAPISPL